MAIVTIDSTPSMEAQFGEQAMSDPDNAPDIAARGDEAKMRSFEITIPIAGHAFLTVEATTEAEAIEIAMSEVTLQHVEEWSALEQFHQGNICYCPRPWEIEATDCGEIEEDEALKAREA